MKKIIGILIGAGLLAGCSSGNSSSSPTTPAFNVTGVQVGKMTGDDAGADFSTKISFTYSGSTTSSWQFGFYMPRSFNKLVSATQNINPNLVMQICAAESATQCASLVYQRESSITSADLSAGYTTVLAPQSGFSLVSGQQYIISLLHNNQWSAGNYSAVPQNFFIISGNNIANNTPESSVYTLLDYDSAAVTTGVTEKMNSNWANSSSAATAINIIPSPVSYIAGGTSFMLADGLVIHNLLSGADNTVANFMKEDLAKDLGISASVDNAAATSGIVIKTISDSALINNNPEGYLINISGNAIVIEVLNNTGAFYALQSLRQLWNQSATLNGATIVDYPRFKYRGVLLDSSRHFFSVPEIESLIDIAATHKLNTLHMHFSDDEGFRIGLDGYNTIPTLADSRGYGNNSMIGLMFLQGNLDKTNYAGVTYPYVNTTYAGTYSEAELKSLISYANARGITIIPEIDMPGHARAMIKAFPQELVDPNDLSQYISVQGYSDDVLPVCTYTTGTSVGPQFTSLINNIVTKTAALFSQQKTLYALNNEISVGGDEVSSGAWSNDSSCSGSWATLDALGKSHKFFQMLSEQNGNLKISGWQQYVQNDDVSLGSNIVPPANSGHVWVWNQGISLWGGTDGESQAMELANSGYPTVLAYADQNYFDLAYTPDINEPGFTWAAAYLDTYSALSSAVSASRTINGVVPAKQTNILGVEGTLWSENLANYNHMIYMALPKMAGLSEAAWSSTAITTENNQPDWQNLATHLGCGQSGFLAYLNKLYGVIYRGYPKGIALEVPSGQCP